MNSVYIHCPSLPAEDYRAVLENLCPQTVRNATVHIHAEHITCAQLKQLMNVQRDFGLQQPVRFRNVLVLSGIPRITHRLRRLLQKHSISLSLQVNTQQLSKGASRIRALAKHRISCKLWSDETDDQIAVYHHFRQLGFPLNLQHPRYTAETPVFFSHWLYDPAAQGINTFCDIITMLTMDTHSPNCRHASCFGTTFCVDTQLQVYLCPWHMDEKTHLGPLDTPDKLLQQNAVAQLLPQVIQKRNNCTNHCQHFSYCQSGCPLQKDFDSECAHYISTVDCIRKSLLEVYRSGDLQKVNPIVKNAILDAIAFGTAFFDSLGTT